jgi:hypothetical protein
VLIVWFINVESRRLRSSNDLHSFPAVIRTIDILYCQHVHVYTWADVQPWGGRFWDCVVVVNLSAASMNFVFFWVPWRCVPELSVPGKNRMMRPWDYASLGLSEQKRKKLKNGSSVPEGTQRPRDESSLGRIIPGPHHPGTHHPGTHSSGTHRQGTVFCTAPCWQCTRICYEVCGST